MKIRFDSDQGFSRKQLDRISEEKVHYKMFKAGKRWLFAGIFLLSLGTGTVGLGGVTGHAETSDQSVSTKVDASAQTATADDSTAAAKVDTDDQGATVSGTGKASTDQSAGDTSNTKEATATDASLSTESQAAVKEDAPEVTTPSTDSAKESTQSTNLNQEKTASSANDEAKRVSPVSENSGPTSVSKQAAALTDLKTATSGMSATEIKAYINNYDRSVLVAGSGTLFVVGDSGDIIPIESRVGSVESDTDTPQATTADKIYSVSNPGSATDPLETQIAYLQGFISRSVQGTGDYTSNAYIGTGTVAAPTQTNVKVKREAKVVDGKVIYSPWTTSDGTVDWNADGSKEILIPALDEATAARTGYTVKVAKDGGTDDAYTSADMDAHIAPYHPSSGGSPAQQGYSAAVTQTATYTARTYTVDNPGGTTDPLGTQLSNLSATINVVTNYAGDYTHTPTTTTVKLSRTASLQKGAVTYSDWTADGAADSTDDTILVPELTASDPSVAVNGYTDTVTNGTTYTLGQFKKQNSRSVTLTRTVTYQAKTYSADNPGSATDPAGTQIAYLRGTITHFVQGEGGYTQKTSIGYGTVAAPSNGGVAVKREAKIVNGKVVYSAWTTSDGTVDWNADGADEILIPALTETTAARAGYTVTTDPNTQFTSDDFNHYIGTGIPSPGTSYAGVYTQKATYTPITYTKDQPGGTDAPKGTQANYLTGTINIETDGTGDYTSKTTSTVSLSRTASLDVNGNVAYSSWTIDGSNSTNTDDSTVLVPELTATDSSLAVKGYTINGITNGTAYTIGQFKSHSTLGDNGYSATIKRTVNYTAKAYSVDNPGGADDPAGTQIAYLRGTITHFVQGEGGYTQKTSIGSGTVAAPSNGGVAVKREAKIVNGKVVYSAWTTSDGTVDWNADGADEVLIPALTETTAARAGYNVKTDPNAQFTSDDFNHYIGTGIPSPGTSYAGTYTQKATYTPITYTKGQAGSANDPVGTQLNYLTGTLTVETDGQGAHTSTTTSTVELSRTASLDTNGNVTYSNWTIDGTDDADTDDSTVLAPELKASDPSLIVQDYTVSDVTNGAAYTLADFKRQSVLGDSGYSATIKRTVNYTANVFSVDDPGGADDPVGTQIAYLRGFISVYAQAEGDYTYSPKNPKYPKYLNKTVIVKREARLDQNGKVTYSPWTTLDGTVDWNANGADKILVPALTAAEVAVGGFTATISTDPVVVDWNKDQPFLVAPFTSDSMNAYIANHTTKNYATGTGIYDQPGYGATDLQTVHYTKIIYTTSNPGGPNDPAGTQKQYLTGTINVVTDYTGDYTRAETATETVSVSRTASVDASTGAVVYSDWTTDGTNTVLVPEAELTGSIPTDAVSGYTATVVNTDPATDGSGYTSSQFNDQIKDQTTPAATGYLATVKRTVNYTANTYSVDHPGVDTKDPSGTQIEYLRGFISVYAQAEGDYTYSPKNPKYLNKTVIVKREARLDKNGKLTYSPWTTLDGTVDWNAKGSDEILVPALTAAEVAVDGYTATISTDPVVVPWNQDTPFSVTPFTSDSMNAYIANHTPKFNATGTGVYDQPGYGATDLQTVRYTKISSTTSTPGGPTDETPTNPNGTTGETPTVPENGTGVETPVNNEPLTADADKGAATDSQPDGSTADSTDANGDGTSQSESVSGGQATVAKSTSVAKAATEQNKLPQTGENETPVGATIGLGLLGILAAFGFRRKKRDDE
ncbi:KxYKxGKxW signal peptide domain-containing protein [Secundilactobacillus mixtipabuli]|uniref:Mannose-specific adhesin, LPXTG-motif cell wall anchor n=1 Tax=Secundilactobacillus mixtipabuli TaxID=1435342 RepID=A0A1Z5IBE8_9LACO|nr:KxYKxGKxW signal peptide domain-containing protein [Secundilactobacillus mixtipabuli]GAW99146.1 mannose-specific adhesin, LPXTG-motif cell wall anchor [Secundilactobacillus mixtipabuli]